MNFFGLSGLARLIINLYPEARHEDGKGSVYYAEVTDGN